MDASSTDTQVNGNECGPCVVPAISATRVRFRTGQLQGAEGELVEWLADGRVLVQLRPGVQVELDGTQVELC